MIQPLAEIVIAIGKDKIVLKAIQMSKFSSDISHKIYVSIIYFQAVTHK